MSRWGIYLKRAHLSPVEMGKTETKADAMTRAEQRVNWVREEGYTLETADPQTCTWTLRLRDGDIAQVYVKEIE